MTGATSDKLVIPPREFIEAVNGEASSYHNHKEQMTYVAFAVQSGVFGFALVSEAWPAAWLPKMLSVLCIGGAMALVHSILVNQILFKQVASFWITYAGLLRYRAVNGDVQVQPFNETATVALPGWWRRHVFPRARRCDVLRTELILPGTESLARTLRMADCRGVSDTILPLASLALIVGAILVTLLKPEAASGMTIVLRSAS